MDEKTKSLRYAKAILPWFVLLVIGIAIILALVPEDERTKYAAVLIFTITGLLGILFKIRK